MDLEKVLKTFGQDQETPEIKDPEPIDYDTEVDKCVTNFNQREISLMDYPPSIRHRSFVLEGKLTAAANEKRREDFHRLLGEWKNCFLTGWTNGHGNQAKMNDCAASGQGMCQRTFSF